MIAGSFLADAATMGLHWIYNPTNIEERITARGGSNPEIFFKPPAAAFYSYDSGKLSPYGEEVVPLLRSMANVGHLDFNDASSTSYEFFKSSKGYLNHCVKSFLERRDSGKDWRECGAEDHQAQGIIKMPLLVARYAGSEELLTKVSDTVGILQNSPQSVDASSLAALVLERVLLHNESPSSAINWLLTSAEGRQRLTTSMEQLLAFVADDSVVTQWYYLVSSLQSLLPPTDQFKLMRDGSVTRRIFPALLALRDLDAAIASIAFEGEDRAFLDAGLAAKAAAIASNKPVSVAQVASCFGISCALPGCILTSLYLARKCTSYSDALRTNIRVGGDNCARSLLLGGLFGGAPGAEVPVAWLEELHPDLLNEVAALSEKVASANPNLK